MILRYLVLELIIYISIDIFQLTTESWTWIEVQLELEQTCIYLNWGTIETRIVMHIGYNIFWVFYLFSVIVGASPFPFSLF